MFKNKYRLIEGTHRAEGFRTLSGYLPQVKYWWFPIMWFDFNSTIYKHKEKALEACKLHNEEFTC